MWYAGWVVQVNDQFKGVFNTVEEAQKESLNYANSKIFRLIYNNFEQCLK